MDLQSLKLEDVVENAKSIAASSKRSILAVAGAPGSGKTTITQSIVKELGPENVVIVPMDGFHLSNTILKKWDRRSRKGAWDTFDCKWVYKLDKSD
jgi:pantothenate kinase